MSELLDGYATPWDAAVASFLSLLTERGSFHRSEGEHRENRHGLTIADHSLQVADLAATDGASCELVVAALLHDLGHLLPDPPGSHRRADGGHEQIAAALLHPWFSEAVVEPVRLHVAAKRFLCTTEPRHLQSMAATSRASFVTQGGEMTADEISLFTASPWHSDAVRLRRWDDRAHDVDRAVPGIEVYLPVLTRLAREHQTRRSALVAARCAIDAAAA